MPFPVYSPLQSEQRTCRQYLRRTLSPTDRAVHSIDAYVADCEDADREALLHVDCRSDGTTVLLYRLVGDREAFADGGLRATLVGTHENLRGALSKMPDAVSFTVENAGPYVPGGEHLLSPLTERQLEVSQTAVDEGYYDVPWRATHKDIANTLECAPSTVDEHLRKAESRVVSGLVQ